MVITKFKNNLIKRYSKKDALQTSIVLIVLFSVYCYLTAFARSDMPAHADFAIKMSQGKITIGNFILYGLINTLSFCFSFLPSLMSPLVIAKISLVFLLALATTYRFRWTYNHLECSVQWQRFLLALSLIFVVAIPIPSIFVTRYLYLGNFTPNVWHNSTTIFLFPFAIMLFTISMKQLEGYNSRRNLWLLLFVFLNIFIKPSYFFVWVCVYPLFLFVKYRLSLKFLKGLIPVVIGMIFLFVEYLWIYYFGGGAGRESSVIIKPFHAYTFYASLGMMPLALLFSLLFPILYFILNLKRLYKNSVFLFVYVSLFVAIAIFMLFMETGVREKNLNFYWQIVICTWLCFYISLSDWLKNREQLVQSRNSKVKFLSIYLPIIIYAVHVIAGIAYLGKYIFMGSYR
ncbi:MAG: hypothetical protein LBE36_14245 [Flavobacteriaceae bacterium]|jgi:hypothetical protein|nr:hypothetical protein [Flavobacteriaceae bacterium]